MVLLVTVILGVEIAILVDCVSVLADMVRVETCDIVEADVCDETLVEDPILEYIVVAVVDIDMVGDCDIKLLEKLLCNCVEATEDIFILVVCSVDIKLVGTEDVDIILADMDILVVCVCMLPDIDETELICVDALGNNDVEISDPMLGNCEVKLGVNEEIEIDIVILCDLVEIKVAELLVLVGCMDKLLDIVILGDVAMVLTVTAPLVNVEL